MSILSWLWANVVVGGAPMAASNTTDSQPIAATPTVTASTTATAQTSTVSDVRGIVVYRGDGYSNTEYGAQGANVAMEVALAHYYPMWRNTGEWRRWQKLDLTDPYYRYAALLNVFQYANPKGYSFKRNPGDPRQLGFFPQ